MNRFILNPNLPQGRVAALICGTDDKSILSFFEERSVTVLKNEPNTLIDPSVATHADMAALHLGGDCIIIDRAQTSLKKELSNYGFKVLETAEAVKGEYPDDVRLNFTLTGGYAAGSFSFADRELLSRLKDRRQINVKQGYCKCSTLVVAEAAAITDDASIYAAFAKNGIDVLLVEKGDISLPGHDYGFIGGASVKIAADTVLFFGDVTRHRDFEKINSFLESHGCGFLCTDNGPLRDIGGAVSLIEE